MRIYFVVFIILGLWTSPYQTFKHKSLTHIFSLFSIVPPFLCVSCLIFFDKLYDFNSLSNAVANSLYIFIIFTHFIIIFESIHRNKIQVSLIERLSLIDGYISTKLGVQIPYHRQKWEIFEQFMVLLLIKFITKLFDKFIAFYFGLTYKYCDLIQYSEFIVFMRLVEILFFIYLLRARLILITKELIKIRKEKEINSALLVYDRILGIKQIYGMLYDICAQIEASFGWSMLSTVTYFFVHFTFNCYWAFMSLSNENIIQMFINLDTLVSSLITMSVITFYCSSCYQEVSTN